MATLRALVAEAMGCEEGDVVTFCHGADVNHCCPQCGSETLVNELEQACHGCGWFSPRPEDWAEMSNPDQILAEYKAKGWPFVFLKARIKGGVDGWDPSLRDALVRAGFPVRWVFVEGV